MEALPEFRAQEDSLFAVYFVNLHFESRVRVLLGKYY